MSHKRSRRSEKHDDDDNEVKRFTDYDYRSVCIGLALAKKKATQDSFLWEKK